jgi:hypothetical protein
MLWLVELETGGAAEPLERGGDASSERSGKCDMARSVRQYWLGDDENDEETGDEKCIW